MCEALKARPETAKEAFRALARVVSDKEVGRASKEDIIFSLIEVVKADPEVAKEVFKALTTLISNREAETYIKMIAAKFLGKVVQANPEIAKEAFETLTTLMSDKEVAPEVKRGVAYSLSEVAKVHTEATAIALQALTWIILDKDADGFDSETAIKSLGEVAKVRPEVAVGVLRALINISNKVTDHWAKKAFAQSLSEIIKVRPETAAEVLKALIEMMQGRENMYIKDAVAESLSEVVKDAPETAEEAFKFLITLMSDKEVERYSRVAAVKFLSEAVKARPETASVALQALTNLMSDKKAYNFAKEMAASSLSAVVEANADTAEEALRALVTLLLDTKTNDLVRRTAIESLSAVVKANPKTAEVALQTLVTILLDKEIGGRAKEAAGESLSEVVKAIQFDVVVDLLKHEMPEIRESTVKGITERLRIPKMLATINYQQIFSLLEIIELCKGQKDESFKMLEVVASNASKVISQNTGSNKETMVWFIENFAKFPNSSEAISFLKELYVQILSSRVITETEKEFIIKCIVEKGLTSTIIPEFGIIVFENASYDIEGAVGGRTEGAKSLQSIAEAVINGSGNKDQRSSDKNDPLAEQYLNHEPLFTNSGSALRVAACDVKDYSMILHENAETSTSVTSAVPMKLTSSKWQVSLMHLSDHNNSIPSKVFVLLERRNYSGKHIVHKISVGGVGNFHEEYFAFDPPGINLAEEITSHIRESIFGDMEYTKTKLRYYGSKYEISTSKGNGLIKTARDHAHVGVSTSANINQAEYEYEAIRELLCAFVDPETTRQLSLPWEVYVAQKGVVQEFNRYELLQSNRNKNSFKRYSADIDNFERHEEKFDSHGKQLSTHDQKLKIHSKAIISLQQASKIAEKVIEDLQTRIDETPLSRKDHQEMVKEISSLSKSVQEVFTKVSAQEKKSTEQDPLIEELVSTMQSLTTTKDLNTKMFLNIRSKIKAIEEKVQLQPQESLKVGIINQINYDNELLNHPELFAKILKSFGVHKTIELGKYLSPSLVQEAASMGDPSIVLAGMMSLEHEEYSVA